METQKQSKIISKVLSPALRFWLRSQVESVEELQVEITGGDRQILGGYIPQVCLNSYRAIYQGLHLGNIDLSAENIRINIGQILKGKPLRLLEPIQVGGEIQLEEDRFQASLSSPLLSSGLSDLLGMLLDACQIDDRALKNYPSCWQEIVFEIDKFSLTGVLIDERETRIPIALRSGLELFSPQILRLHPLQLEIGLPGWENITLSDFRVDLGSDVELDTLKLEPGQLLCRGRLLVRSE